MNDSNCEIETATHDDIAAILDLQESNLREHGGALSARFSRQWFETAIRDMPVLVARDTGTVVGYVVSTSMAAQAHVPIIAAMLRAYPGSPDAYNYGPICVAESHRGRGLALSLFEALRERLPGREAVSFIRADNISSRRAHGKMGMRETAEFSLGGVAYLVVVYPG
jgi:L-amino acid N-acyltransferase YncA